MADSDLKEDLLPKNTARKSTGTVVSALRTALSTFNGTYYTATRLNQMTKRDMEYAAKANSLTVAGL